MAVIKAAEEIGGSEATVEVDVLLNGRPEGTAELDRPKPEQPRARGGTSHLENMGQRDGRQLFEVAAAEIPPAPDTSPRGRTARWVAPSAAPARLSLG